jgi:hypothetical protein
LCAKCSKENRMANNIETDSIIEGDRNGFYFHVLSILANRGNAITRQLFFTSLLLKHKGLSRSGLQIQNQMNLALSPRMFDVELRSHLVLVRNQRRSCVLVECVNFTFSNLCVVLLRNFPTLCGLTISAKHMQLQCRALIQALITRACGRGADCSRTSDQP